MNIHKLAGKLAVMAAIGAMALPGVMSVRADDAPLAPEVVVVSDESLSQSIENVETASYAFPKVYVSSPGTGNVGGYGYADEDIMLYNTGTGAWSKAFDGTNAGLNSAADIDALATIINSGYLSFLMSFDQPAAVPGLGTVDDSDVLRYDTFNGQWSMYLDGSTVGLTTDAEDVDALTFSPGGYLALSTAGGFAVKNMEGGTLKGKDEDLFLLVDKNAAEFTLWLKGATLGLQSTNDIRGASFMPVNDSLVDSARYIVPQSSFSLPNGTAVGANDVSQQTWYKSGYVEYGKRLDASDIGFPKIDAIEVVK